MKKLGSLLLALFLILSSLVGAQPLLAQPVSSQVAVQPPSDHSTSDQSMSKSVTISEIDYIKKLQNESKSELKTEGLTDQEINNLPTVEEYKQELGERGKLSHDDLVTMGYTEDQIKMLQNFTGSEEELSVLSAEVNITGTVTDYVYTPHVDKTELDTRLQWDWTSKPVYEFTDIVAIAWLGGFAQTGDYDSNNYVSIRYKSSIGYTDASYRWNIKMGNGCDLTFPMSNQYGGNWAQSGIAETSAVTSGYITSIGVNFSYGHQEVNVTPTVSFPGGIGISFGAGTQTTTRYVYRDYPRMSTPHHGYTDDLGRTVDIPDEINYYAPSGALAQAALYSVDPGKLAGLASNFTPAQLDYVDLATYPQMDPNSTTVTPLPVFGEIYDTIDGPGAYDEGLVSASDAQVIIDIGQFMDDANDTFPHQKMISDFNGLQSRTGIPVVFINAEDIGDYATMYDKLGQILNDTTQTAPLEAYCDNLTSYIVHHVSDATALYRTIYYGEGSDGLLTNGTSGLGAIHQNLLGYIGLVNVADITSSSGVGRTAITFGTLDGWDPDMIILGPDAATLYNQLITVPPTSPNWAGLSAVITDKVALAPNAFLDWIDRPPSINRLLGTEWLMHLAFPDVYTDYADSNDFLDDVIDFYQLFYHYDLTPRQQSNILSTAEFANPY